MTIGTVNLTLYGDDALSRAREISKAFNAAELAHTVTFFGLADDRGGECVFGDSGLVVVGFRGDKIKVSVDGSPAEWLAVVRLDRVHVGA